MARLNWEGDRARRIGRERGASDDDDLAELLAQSPYRPLGRAPSKAELRQEAAALVHTGDPVTLAIRCPCGRSARVTVPAGREKIRLRCTGCDRVIERKVQ